MIVHGLSTWVLPLFSNVDPWIVFQIVLFFLQEYALKNDSLGPVKLSSYYAPDDGNGHRHDIDMIDRRYWYYHPANREPVGRSPSHVKG